MGKVRPPIPKNVEYDVIFKNDMTCCICHDKNKRIIIHHIDENPSNNSIGNLAILCQDHHDEVHSKGGLTKNITPQVLLKYKKQWESFNENKMKINSPPLHSKIGIEKVLFEFEIRKTAYEILSLNADDKSGLKQKMEYLYSINTLEGYTDEILNALGNIAILVSFDDYKSSILSENLHHYVWHFVDPKDLPLTKGDKSNFFKIVDILSTIGCFSSEFNKNIDVNRHILISLEFLGDISIEYDIRDLAKKIIDVLEEIIEKGKIDLGKDDGFNQSIAEMNESLSDFKTLITKKRPKWVI